MKLTPVIADLFSELKQAIADLFSEPKRAIAYLLSELKSVIADLLTGRIQRRIVAGVGYVAIALAVLVAFVPRIGDAVAVRIGGVFGNPVLVVLAGLAAGTYGVVQLYRIGSDAPSRDPLVRLAPERAHYREHRITGSGIDESVASVAGELPESAAKGWWAYRERSDVKRALTDVAVDVLAAEHDVSRLGAARLVKRGSWTDDDRAAAFLAEDRASALSLRAQFLDWLSGRAFEKRVNATVAEIARQAGVEGVGAHSESDRSRTADDSALDVAHPNGTVHGSRDGPSAASREEAVDASDADLDSGTGLEDERSGDEGAPDEKGEAFTPFPVNTMGPYGDRNRGDGS